MLQISTSNLKDRKKVEIDGHPYTVRRLGAGEQLTLNQLLRQSKKLEELSKTSDIDQTKFDSISSKIMELFTGLFDDGGDQSKSKSLVASLNESEVQELFSQIFKDDFDGLPETS